MTRVVTFRFDFKNDVKYVLGSGNTIDWSISPTAYSQRGVRHGKTRTGSSLLERVGVQQGIGGWREQTGGGYGVFVFKESTLTLLRTEGSAAFKREIIFVHGPEGLACTANEAIARENGIGPINWRSAIDDAPVTIASWKQISSTCRVKKQAEVSAK
jgi:hypothetical protein